MVSIPLADTFCGCIHAPRSRRSYALGDADSGSPFSCTCIPSAPGGATLRDRFPAQPSG
jgi:hypothetical protein